MAREPSERSPDPLGKRALFSAGNAPRTVSDATEAAPKARRAPGLFDLDVHCSACGRTTTMGAQAFALQHFPLWAWAPWRKDAHFMRCPACGQLAWHSVKRTV